MVEIIGIYISRTKTLLYLNTTTSTTTPTTTQTKTTNLRYILLMITFKTSVDVLPSKNQALCEYCTHSSKLILLISLISVFIKSCEKRLITKEHIITDTYLTFVFKWAVHFSTLATKLFSSSTKLF